MRRRFLPSTRSLSFFLIFPCIGLLAVSHSSRALAATAEEVAVAPGHGALSGTVVDAVTGNPVAHARLAIKDGEATAVTTGRGDFDLPAPGRTFVLVVTSPGYEPRVVRVEGGREKPLEIRLSPVKGSQDEIVVTDSRYPAEVPLTTTNITAKELAQRAPDQDIPMLLEDVPGVYATSDAGTGAGYTYLSIRGFDQKRIGVTVNGIPLNDPEDQQVYWVDLPDFASSLEDIQVQRGVVNGFGGVTAIGGTVNLVTDVLGPDPAARMAVHGGSFGTGVQSLSYQSGLLGGRFASGLRISHLQSDGYRDRSGTDQWGFFWTGKMVGARTTTQVNVYGGHERTQQAWYGIDADTWASDPSANPETYWNAIDDFSQPHLEIHHEWRLGRNVTLTNAFYAIHGYGFYENYKEGADPADFSLDVLLGDLQTGPPWAFHPASVDLVRRKYVTKEQAGWVPSLEIKHPHGRLVTSGDAYLFWSRHWGDVLWVEGQEAGDLGNGLEYYGYHGYKNAFSLQADEQVEVVKNLTLLANLQYQHRSYSFLQDDVASFQHELRNGYTVAYDFLNPRGGLSWAVPAKVAGARGTVYTWAGISHREPSDAELFDTWDGPDDPGVTPLFGHSEQVMGQGGEVDHVEWSDPMVKAERVLDIELGTTWRGSVVDLALDGYLMDFRNEIVDYGTLSDDGIPVRGNAGQTAHRGVEGSLGIRPTSTQEIALSGSRSWDHFVDFTYYDWDGNTASYAGNPIALFPGWIASLRWRGDWKFFETNLRARGIGRIYLDNTGLTAHSVDPSLVVDAGIGTRPASFGIRGLKGLEVTLLVRNVVDEKYALTGYFDAWGGGDTYMPAAGRNWLCGATWTF
jgi:iron complex outermembrane recepter protein